MKNVKYLVLSLHSILIMSCSFFEDDYSKLVKETKIDPRFEKSPPIASSIEFEVLEKTTKNGENIRFVADMKNEKLGSKYLALLLNETKVVLRDDGKGADKTADDQKFSIFLKEDENLLKNEVAVRQKQVLSTKSPLVFNNRSLSFENGQSIRQFNLSELQKGKSIKIPIDLFKGIKVSTNPAKTLMITDKNVVEDPVRTFNFCTGEGNVRGSWTFGELMRQMASPNPASIASDAAVSTFIRNWLNTWLTNQSVNAESLDARTNIQFLIQDWERKSGVGVGGQLKMQFAPFKLIAIVNRLDLRGNSGYGFSNAGEGRLVFNAVGNRCNPLKFTVIFEYGINKKSCTAVKAFAQEWSSLNDLALGSAAYNDALQQITDQFTLCGTNSMKPNQNSINQIRTNEIDLGNPWELREFNLATSGQLNLVTVKQEPAVKYNTKTNNPDVVRLANFINSNELAIVNNNYDVPLSIALNAGSPTPTTEFLGGKSHTLFPPTGAAPTAHHWNGTASAGPAFVNNDDARHVFSLNTCSGCHGGETQTKFTHINPVGFGSTATLSGFLTGIEVRDAANRPFGRPAVRNFNDLARRNMDLANLLDNICIKRPFFELAHKLTFKPIRMTH
jgi:hypothetical protein